MKIAIIPARSGSKRIKNKNIKNFYGVPIISYMLKEIGRKNFFDKIIVDTDSTQIAKIVKNYKAEVPFFRPKRLSHDKSKLSDTLSFTIKKLIKENIIISNSNICCIFPTAFLIKLNDIKKAYLSFLLNKPEYILAATKYNYSVRRSFEINKKQTINMLFPEYYSKRSQDINDVYHDAGQFYWGKSDTFIKKKRVITSKSIIYEISNKRVIDIDTMDDWNYAKLLFKINNKK